MLFKNLEMKGIEPLLLLKINGFSKYNKDFLLFI